MRYEEQRLDPHEIARLVGKAIGHVACALRPDVLAALKIAQAREKAAQEGSERACSVLSQLIENASIAACDRVPLCQDTGTVWVLLEAGRNCVIPTDIFAEVDAAVADAYASTGLRMSLVRDSLIDRRNSGDNTPAFCELALCPERVGARLHVMLKGGGSDNASRIVMLPPGEGLAGVRRVVVEAIVEKAANACPPLVVGVGVGTTFDKVATLSKRALLRELGSVNERPEIDLFERELLEAVNATGIGPGGFGGQTTALAVHVLTAPSHIAALPVAVNIGCCALRSVSLDVVPGKDKEESGPSATPGDHRRSATPGDHRRSAASNESGRTGSGRAERGVCA
ncbi:MAG: fumarate hydratase [Coriobacteriales bacterium]|jgi:tartrate/fumarate subfamily iron-sulfur-dependent hydro-lyase alpha chain|nr:fumarate hydratase [Coriobacteriales bacterium]